ncbi:spore coat protein [Paenibacillus sp. FJAT-26967]|uniref:spore coat protein n=1 Tax=Paenibacillus sp. FJAT-26967 TaxID=1729690 RepID=UPI000AA65CE0|nr:spore coat protein [Paenibacillus sp. FJAT-26967]
MHQQNQQHQQQHQQHQQPQQHQYSPSQQQSSSVLKDQDLLYTILSDLKRVVREYATAATESNCPSIRQLFNQLTLDSLQLQGELYTFMKQNNMYNAASPALRQEIEKHIQSYHKSEQKTQQLVSQYVAGRSQNAFQYTQPSTDYTQPSTNYAPTLSQYIQPTQSQHYSV